MHPPHGDRQSVVSAVPVPASRPARNQAASAQAALAKATISSQPQIGMERIMGASTTLKTPSWGAPTTVGRGGRAKDPVPGVGEDRLDHAVELLGGPGLLEAVLDGHPYHVPHLLGNSETIQ